MENLAGYALEANIGGVSMLRGEAGKSAYQYAVEGGYTGTEEEFAAKLAEEMPDALPNPNALTFTGAVTGSYDGSAPLSVEIPNGKSAYQYAVEGGYTGTETEFAEKLASGALIIHVTDNNGTLSADKSYNDIENVIHAGTTVLVSYNDVDLPLTSATAEALYFGTIMCDSGDDSNPAVVATSIIEITQNGEVNDISAVVATLPNPNAITFTGAVTGSYDGSAGMTVNIPSAVTDAHINSLIDTKLGVIENGSY